MNILNKISTHKKFFLFVLFLAIVLVTFSVSYLQSSPTIYNLFFRAKLIRHIPGDIVKLDDLNTTLDVMPNLKGVVTSANGEGYSYSVLGEVDGEVKLPSEPIDPRKQEPIKTQVNVKLATGQEAQINFNTHETEVYWYQETVDSNSEKFITSNSFFKEGIEAYYFVDYGFQYLASGDKLNIVWGTSLEPFEVLLKGGIFKDEVLDLSPAKIFAKR